MEGAIILWEIVPHQTLLFVNAAYELGGFPSDQCLQLWQFTCPFKQKVDSSEKSTRLINLVVYPMHQRFAKYNSAVKVVFP
jgi:hypothetical protein